MDSILSTVLSDFTHNPIFVLAIIAYIVFSFLKSSKTEDTDEYETSGAEKTWEDMEREYGISIERKIEESPVNATSNDAVYQSSNTQISYNQSAEQPKKEQPKQREEHKVSTSKTVAVSTLTERLAEFKRQKAMEEVKIPLVDVETHAKTVTTKARKSRHDIKEGMKWAFILEKPKALRHRAR
ncbi:MAG: hypothetical protein KH125_02335 [Veillonella sp.]|uniref:hypothetical protein n=1 Tax=Veillonella sp. TaxID=1926307 RepID=UPI00257D0798|nr:hypothetical protein [Veillonella sp.]MBS7012257.1 hypothetical protein [Veillonella sp.]